MSYIFISHVEEDAGVAEEIASGLEAAGYSTWYYERDSLPGLSYLSQILEAIREAVAIVVIISRNSLGSWQVDKEIIEVHESGKPFIPLLKDVTHAEFRAQRPEWALAMGAATSTPIPPQGISAILPRIIKGLARVGVPAEDQKQGSPMSPDHPAFRNVEAVPVVHADAAQSAVTQEQTIGTQATETERAGTLQGTGVQQATVRDYGAAAQTEQTYVPSPEPAPTPRPAPVPAPVPRPGGPTWLRNPITWAVAGVAVLVIVVVIVVLAVSGGGKSSASPTATPQSILMQDNFSDPNAGSLDKSSGDTHFNRGYKNGMYYLSILDPKWSASNVAYENLDALGSVANTSLSIDTQLASTPASGRYIVLACRYATRQGRDSEYRLLTYPGDGTFELERYYLGHTTALAGPAPAASLHRGSAWNHLTLNCVGNQISASINGTQIPAQTDNMFSTGKLWIGLGVDSQGTGEAHFRNLIVYKR